MLLWQGIVEHLKPSVPYAEGDNTGSIEPPFLIIYRIQPALIKAVTGILLGHFTQLGRSLSKMDYSDAP